MWIIFFFFKIRRFIQDFLLLTAKEKALWAENCQQLSLCYKNKSKKFLHSNMHLRKSGFIILTQKQSIVPWNITTKLLFWRETLWLQFLGMQRLFTKISLNLVQLSTQNTQNFEMIIKQSLKLQGEIWLGLVHHMRHSRSNDEFGSYCLSPWFRIGTIQLPPFSNIERITVRLQLRGWKDCQDQVKR